MTEFIELPVVSRSEIGKANRKLHDKGLIPGVIYSKDVEAVPLSIDRHKFELLMRQETLSATVLNVTLDDGAKSFDAIVKVLQVHPVSGRVEHVDLLVVDLKKVIQTHVAIEFVGESVGVKEGGILTHNILEVEIEALPTELPDHLSADITELNIGDTLHVSDLVIPESVTVLTDLQELVCSITAPSKIEEEEVVEGEEGEEGEEPELVGEETEEEAEESAE